MASYFNSFTSRSNPLACIIYPCFHLNNYPSSLHRPLVKSRRLGSGFIALLCLFSVLLYQILKKGKQELKLSIFWCFILLNWPNMLNLTFDSICATHILVFEFGKYLWAPSICILTVLVFVEELRQEVERNCRGADGAASSHLSEASSASKHILSHKVSQKVPK